MITRHDAIGKHQRQVGQKQIQSQQSITVQTQKNKSSINTEK